MPARLVEVELRVRDLDRALRFYRDLVGLPFGEIETHANDSTRHVHATWGAWDSRGDFLMINLYPAGPEGPNRSSIGFAVDELARIHERMREAGVTVVSAPVRKPWGASATYRDPDGNSVSLSERPRAES